MVNTSHLRVSDLRGLSRLAIEAIAVVTDPVGAMHNDIAS